MGAPASAVLALVAAVGAELGVRLPPAPSVPSPEPVVSSSGLSSAGALSGWTRVSGNGFLPCSAGERRGSVELSGQVRVVAADGASGSVPVRGAAQLSGRCDGPLRGSASLQGTGSLRSRGRHAGYARLWGTVQVSLPPSGDWVWVDQEARLDGTYSASPPAIVDER